MEAAVIAIDAIIATKPVRWLLLVLVALLLLVSGFSLARQRVLSLQLSAVKGEKAEYAAQLLTQNAAIIKAGLDMEQLLKKLQAANAEAAKIGEDLKKRQVELGRVILKGTCPEMVQQVLDEVRK